MKNLSVAHRLLESRTFADYWDAVVFLVRSGKLREFLYFCTLEIYYWSCSILKLRSRFVKLAPSPSWHYDAQHYLELGVLASALGAHNLAVSLSKVKWVTFTQSDSGTVFGSTYERPNVLHQAKGVWSTPIALFCFDAPIIALFVSKKDIIFVSTIGYVYQSDDHGAHFNVALKLSDKDSFIWHNHGIDEAPQGIIMGEYGSIVDDDLSPPALWKSVAYLYVTHDDGKSWQRIDTLRRGGAKHVHLVKYSSRLSRVMVTDGDKCKRSYWTSLCEDQQREFRTKRFDSFWSGGGHTAFAETSNATVIGTDHHWGVNSIITLTSSTRRKSKLLPYSYMRSPVINMHSTAYQSRETIFASLHNGFGDRHKSALICSDDCGSTWHVLVEYDGRFANFEILNGQTGSGQPLLLGFCNRISDQRSTFVIRPKTHDLRPRNSQSNRCASASWRSAAA